ncbi:MAG: hypothetical protein H0Z40_10305 [Desulfotomaculum sp.]|nr:hypothetical protein [Desulfotomaculum sp.]
MKGNILQQLAEVKDYFVELFSSREQKLPGLIEMIDNAQLAWKMAVDQLNYCDKDMLDYVIFDIHAKERRFMTLLMQARKQGVAAWSGGESHEKFSPRKEA